MVRINENIRWIRKKLEMTQDQFATRLGIKRSLVGAYEEGRAEPRLELLQQMAQLAGLSVDVLISKDLASMKDIAAKPAQVGSQVLVVTVDSEQRDNIELVPHKAAAGYLNGYADTEFIRELPRFKLPMLKQGTYRAFEISGDSMLPILPGTIVIGEYVERIDNLKSGKTYVLVTQREGIVYKRVFNYLQENGKLFLVSDNRQYAPYPIDLDDVIEAWAAKAYISVQFPDVESRNETSIEQLSSIVLDLQQEIVKLKKKDLE
ncbi:MAG: LexA family transcriptional regulator [Cyclobacteriaceae bacterium]|nr:LexA family transcriptional regulator [Cyclobacteriaceae bacterium]